MRGLWEPRNREQARRLPAVDGLRAVAIVLVLLFHWRVPGFSGGFTGVDVFFVVSGFVITTQILCDVDDGRFSIVEFYRRRALRLLPALYVVVAIVLFVTVLRGAAEDVLTVSSTTIAALLFGANVELLSGLSYFSPALSVHSLAHIWSLAVEEQFYFVWPVVLLGLRALGPRVGAGVLLGAVAALLLVSESTVRSNVDVAFFLLPSRAFEFLIGAFVAMTGRIDPRRARIQNACVGLGMALIASSLFLLTEGSRHFPGVNALLPTLGATFLILGSEARFAAPLRSRPAQLLGRVSYAVYLVHWPVTVWTFQGNVLEPTPFELAVVILLTVSLALVVHVGIEAPIRRLGVAGGRPASRAAALVAASGVALAVAALSLRDEAERQYYTSPRAASVERPFVLGSDGALGARSTSGRFDIAIVGDSHAEHLLFGLDRVLDAEGLSGVFISTMSGVPPLRVPPLLNLESTARSSRDVEMNAGIVDRLRRADPVVVLLAGRWPAFLGRAPEGPFEIAYTPDASVREPRDVLALGFLDTMSEFQDRRVVVIGSPPYFRLDGERCLAPRFLDGMSGPLQRASHLPPANAAEIRCPGLSYKDQMELASSSEELLAVLATEMGFQYVSLVDRLCDVDRGCEYFRNGVPNHADDDHLSDAQSLQVARWLSDVGALQPGP